MARLLTLGLRSTRSGRVASQAVLGRAQGQLTGAFISAHPKTASGLSAVQALDEYAKEYVHNEDFEEEGWAAAQRALVAYSLMVSPEFTGMAPETLQAARALAPTWEHTSAELAEAVIAATT